MIKRRTSPAASLWKWRCSQDFWASLTFKYSQLWNIALPTSLLRKETMATVIMIEEHLVWQSLYSYLLDYQEQLNYLQCWHRADQPRLRLHTRIPSFTFFLLGFKKTPEICKIVKNYFISHRLVIGIESVSTLSPHPTETGFNFLLSNHWGT